MNARQVCKAVACALLLALAVAAPALGQEKPDITWYGFVKLDAAWDEGLIDAGNFARWVVPHDMFDPHAHFNMTARQTRLGLRAAGRVGGASAAAVWESDFYGGGAENKNALQVRHAYVEVTWPSGWSVLAGQASDVISPLVPATLNYTVAWWAGNTGYRRPQLRLARVVDLGGGRQFRIQGAATRTIGDDFVSAEPGDAGADSGMPTFQGLAGFALPLSGRTLGIGAFAHRGKENLHKQLGGEDVYLWSSGWGGYLTLPLGGALTLSGEAWTGSNMDDYLGGIGHGMRVTEDLATSVGVAGGWAELAWRGSQGVRAQVGASLDDPDDTDLGAGFRARNMAAWGTVVKDFGGGLSSGLEVSRWATRYVGHAESTSWRVQGSVIYAF